MDTITFTRCEARDLARLLSAFAENEPVSRRVADSWERIDRSPELLELSVSELCHIKYFYRIGG